MSKFFKEFYRKIHNWYLKVLNEKKQEDIIGLIIRTIFLWFLKKINFSNSITSFSFPDYFPFEDKIDKEAKDLEDILNSYDFSLNETEENKLTPEVLGKVFENLLTSYNKNIITLRKATGSYYTPKVITDYMINETLKEYLKDKIPYLTENELNNLLSESKEKIKLEKNKRKEITKAIYELKIIDPACGSGNFLITFLHKLLHILSKIDNINTNTKLQLINNLYGVDILPLAIEITKLRFLIFLLTNNIKTLPGFNNFITADTLLNFKKDNYFDIVITNPPYVRQEKIVDIKKKLKNYEVYTSTADLYVYFYEKGIKLLKERGILSYITSNKWLRAKYGEKLRDYLKNYKVLKIIDFGGYRVFEQTVDTNIIIIKKEKSNDNIVKFLEVSKDVKKENLISYINDIKNWNELKQSKLNKTGWILTKDEVLKLKEKIERIGKPLKDWDVKIYRGILTGYNEAFIIDNETRNRILSNCKDEEERKRTQELIKPILRGRDIGKYYYKWAGLWVIVIPAGWTNKNRGKENPEKFFKEKFQSLYNYFMSFSNVKTKGRGLFDRDDQGDYWWELRHCSYYSEFEKEKIVWAGVGDTLKTALVAKKFLINNPANFLVGDKLYFLQGVINSKVVTWYYEIIKTRLGNEGGRFYIYDIFYLPIPLITDANRNIEDEIVTKVKEILFFTGSEDYENNKEKQEKVKNLEREINELVYKLYDLTQDQIKIIQESK